MALTKESQSMLNMFIDDSLDNIEDGFHSAPREYRNDLDFDDDDEDIHGAMDDRFRVCEEKVVRNEDGEKKVIIEKEWNNLQDERTKTGSDLVIIKADDMRFTSSSDLFSYTDIGEPQKEQHVLIDFSPEKGVDDDRDLLDKCSSFWKFIEQYPELQSLKAEPGHLEDVEVGIAPSSIKAKVITFFRLSCLAQFNI